MKNNNRSKTSTSREYLSKASRVTGEIVQKPSWGKDQPNNYNGEQNCVVLDGGRGWLWNDVGCNLDYLHWICQSSKCGREILFANDEKSG